MTTKKELELEKQISGFELEDKLREFEKKINASTDDKLKTINENIKNINNINNKLINRNKITNKQLALIISAGVVIFSLFFKDLNKNVFLIQLLKELFK